MVPFCVDGHIYTCTLYMWCTLTYSISGKNILCILTQNTAIEVKGPILVPFVFCAVSGRHMQGIKPHIAQREHGVRVSFSGWVLNNSFKLLLGGTPLLLYKVKVSYESPCISMLLQIHITYSMHIHVHICVHAWPYHHDHTIVTRTVQGAMWANPTRHRQNPEAHWNWLSYSLWRFHVGKLMYNTLWKHLFSNHVVVRGQDKTRLKHSWVAQLSLVSCCGILPTSSS